MRIDNDIVRDVQENVKRMMEERYKIYHTCMIDDDKLYFCFQEGTRLQVNIEMRVNLIRA